MLRHEDRPAFVKAVMDEYLLPVLNAKGPDYSKQTVEQEDANANFKTVAARMPKALDKYLVWAVYFYKHMLSLETWLNRREVLSEKLEGRLTDLINYLLILWSMLAEDALVPWPKDFTPAGGWSEAQKRVS